MEQKILPVIFSSVTYQSLEAIYEYGSETFSPAMAEAFVSDFIRKLERLCSDYYLYPECRFLPTKSKKYRMFTYVSYLVVYRITEDNIEVLTLLHKSRSIAKIRGARRIKI